MRNYQSCTQWIFLEPLFDRVCPNVSYHQSYMKIVVQVQNTPKWFIQFDTRGTASLTLGGWPQGARSRWELSRQGRARQRRARRGSKRVSKENRGSERKTGGQALPHAWATTSAEDERFQGCVVAAYVCTLCNFKHK